MQGIHIAKQVSGPFPISTVSGTNLGISDSPDNRSFHEVTIINDTTEDLLITFYDSTGVKHQVIVPESIKGFTTRMGCENKWFNLSSFVVNSVSDSSEATGKITLNFLG